MIFEFSPDTNEIKYLKAATVFVAAFFLASLIGI